MERQYDAVIVGCGVAGCFTALHLPREMKILMITKSDLEESDSFLAQGGIYENSTNYPHLTGDALAIALKHQIRLQDVSYVQIHPTTLYSTKKERRFLISESVRGEGAHLYDKNGRRFANELMPRDILSQAIRKQLEKDGTDFVWLSMLPIRDVDVRKRFPNIYRKCLEEGYDVTRDCMRRERPASTVFTAPIGWPVIPCWKVSCSPRMPRFVWHRNTEAAAESRDGRIWIVLWRSCKQDGVIAGLPVFQRVFELLDDKIQVKMYYKDGDDVKKGDLLAEVTGDIRAILSGERTALNFLQRMSGIATYTRSVAKLLEGSGIRLLDNMSHEDMKKAVELIAGRAETECSGNITKENIAKMADIGVDYVSSGALTHSAPILDVSLKNLRKTV